MVDSTEPIVVRPPLGAPVLVSASPSICHVGALTSYSTQNE